jgi:aerobic carbon-monoxide dehydrogenase large subunit
LEDFVRAFGIKGADQSGITAVGAAIANAVEDAIRMPGAITELPITPQRLKEVLRGAAMRSSHEILIQ